MGFLAGIDAAAIYCAFDPECDRKTAICRVLLGGVLGALFGVIGVLPEAVAASETLAETVFADIVTGVCAGFEGASATFGAICSAKGAVESFQKGYTALGFINVAGGILSIYALGKLTGRVFGPSVNGANNGIVNDRTPAQRMADKIREMNLPKDERPTTVAVIRTSDGRYYIGTNANGKGGVFNSQVQKLLDFLGTSNRFNRKCAEVNAVSRAVNAGANLKGATISVSYVRGPNSLTNLHGQFHAPCSVCKPMLDILGIEVLKW